MTTTPDLKKTRRRKSDFAISTDRLPPHDDDAEAGVLGCIMLSPQCVDECNDRLSGRHDVFYDLRNQHIFSAVTSLRRAGEPIDTITIADWLKGEALLNECGGIAYLASLPDKVPSAANLSYYLDIVWEKYQLRKLIHICAAAVEKAQSHKGEVGSLLSAVRCDFERITQPVESGESFEWLDLTEFETSRDPNNIIGVRHGKATRYLCKGHAAWLIGPSGVGKSALLFQFGAAWACGQSMFGIATQQPRRVLLIQAENDMGDLAEMARGIEGGLNLTFDENQLEMLKRNIRIRSVKGKIGQQFCEWLRREIESFGAEIVLIDPLLSFAGIDVSRQDQVSQFCRVWLDPILHKTGAVLISAHHTGKPPTQNGKKPQPQSLTDLAYAGIGSSELVNWARAVMLLQNAGEGVFRLQLAKRGRRACATHPDGSPTQTLWLRHATNDSIFWEQIDPPEEVEEKQHERKERLPTKPQQVASLNLSSFLTHCTKDGETLRGLIKRLSSWLASKDCPKKSLAQMSHGSLNTAVGLLLDNEKLKMTDGLYFKGPNA